LLYEARTGVILDFNIVGKGFQNEVRYVYKRTVAVFANCNIAKDIMSNFDKPELPRKE